jgi:hypothetical protein
LATPWLCNSTERAIIAFVRPKNALHRKILSSRPDSGFHHSGPEIPGSAREGKPRSFFLCFYFIVYSKNQAAVDIQKAAGKRAVS